MPRIQAVYARTWTLPLHAPFAIAKRTAHAANNVLIAVRTNETVGLGESAPVTYVTGESVDTVLAAIEEVAPLFTGLPLERLEPLWSIVARELFDAPAARAGLEMALLEVWAQHWRLPLWQFFGAAQDTLTTDVTVPLVPPDTAANLAKEAWDEGFRHLKLKVGHVDGHTEDLARVEAVIRACPHAALRIDANQAFDVDEAVTFVQEVIRMGARVELLEQPVDSKDVAGLQAVRERVNVPVFADEAARTPAEVLHLLTQDAVDGINVKLQKSGLAGAMQIIQLCRTAGKRLMLGCMLESRLGIAAAAHMAGGTGAFDFLDLDSHRLLCPVSGLAGGFDVQSGTLHINGEMPGWGVVRQENLLPDENNPHGDGNNSDTKDD